MTSSHDLPSELTSYDHWICWRNECRDCEQTLDPSIKECPDCVDDDGEPVPTTKRPINPETGAFAKANDRSTWTSLEDARSCHRRDGVETHGLGFMFHADDPFTGVDLDDCRDPETGEIDEWALAIVRRLASFVEVSPSGTGLHVYVYAEKPEGRSRKGDVEMYDRDRYFTVTGDAIPQSHSEINYRQDELEAVHEGHVQGGEAASPSPSDLDLDVDVRPADEIDDEFENDLGESLKEIRERDDKLDDLLTDLEPDGYDYPSASEADYATVEKLWWYRFGRQQITDIFQLFRYRPKAERPSTYLGAATGEQYDPRPTAGGDVEILDDRERYESITDVEWPDPTVHFVLDKPPREGGSYASIKLLSRKPLVVVASRHAICEHHLDILKAVMPDGKCAVHYEGSHRSCRNPERSDCPNVVGTDGDYQARYEVMHAAKEAVHENRILTADDCPDEFCPHQFLKMATEYAHATVTVPQLLPKLDDVDFAGRNLLVDEEQALAYFRPDSTELASITRAYEPDGTVRVQVRSSNVSEQFETLEKIREDIYDRWCDRRSDEGGWRRTSIEKDVLNAIHYLQAIKRSMGVSDIVEELENDEDVDAFGLRDVLDEIMDRVNSIERPPVHTAVDEFRSKLDDFVDAYYYKEQAAPGEMIEAALFGYDDRPFDFKKAGDGYKIRMIAGREVFHADDLLDFEQMGVIAGPEGELFFDDLGLDARTIIIDDFRYADDFVVVPIGAKRDGEMESPSTQRLRCQRVSNILNDRAHPHLAVAGTKDRAMTHHASLDSGPADIIASPESPAKDIWSTWSVGGTGVIYENSAVSRGIDAPAFDITVVVSSGFATPYWEARRTHYRGEDEDEYQYAKAVEAQLKSRELTNAVLRPAPTPSIDEHYGTKFIVVSNWDAPKLRYLQDSIMPRFARADSAANFLEQLTIGGGHRTEVNRLYDALGQSESDFIEEMSKSEIVETKHDRPSYDLDELERWHDNRYFHTRGVVGDLEDAIPPSGEVDREFLLSLFDSWSEGRVTNSLTVLEGMGIIRSFTEETGESRRPKKLWSKESL